MWHLIFMRRRHSLDVVEFVRSFEFNEETTNSWKPSRAMGDWADPAGGESI
jgi:hypothetical protein